MTEKGTFREDLYYRLNVFPITIPPLRDRGSDIISLADYFVTQFAAETGKDVKRISTPALNMLMAYHWPGNVRAAKGRPIETRRALKVHVLIAKGGFSDSN